MILNLILDKYKEDELKSIYKNIKDKHNDFYKVEISDLTKAALLIIRDKYGKGYTIDNLYQDLAFYFANKYLEDN